MKTKKKIIAFAALVIAGGTLGSFIKSDKKYFDGVIHYKIVPEILDDRVDTNFINRQYGKYLDYYYSNGNFRKEFLDAGKKPVRIEIYNQRKNIFYPDIRLGDDTVKYYQPLYDGFEVVSISYTEPETKDTVLGKVCSKTEFLVYDKEQTDVHLSYEYFTHPDLAIDASKFNAFRDGGWYKIQKEIKSLAYKWIRKNERLKLTFVAVSVERKELDEKNFMPPSKPLKKIR